MPGLPAAGHVVSADHGHAGDLRVVLVSALGGGAHVGALARVSRGPDEDLVIDRDLVVDVDVVLRLVVLGGEDHVDPRHRLGHRAPDIGVRRQVTVPRAVPAISEGMIILNENYNHLGLVLLHYDELLSDKRSRVYNQSR